MKTRASEECRPSSHVLGSPRPSAANRVVDSMPWSLRGRAAWRSLRHVVEVASEPSSDSKADACRYAARSRALNDSTCALSVGSPGRLKSSLASSRSADASRARDANSVLLSTLIADGFRWGLDSRLRTSITSCAVTVPETSVARASRTSWSTTAGRRQLGVGAFSEHGARAAGPPCRGSGPPRSASTRHARLRAASAVVPPSHPRHAHRVEPLPPPVEGLLGHAEPSPDPSGRLPADACARASVIGSSGRRFFFARASASAGGRTVREDSQSIWLRNDGEDHVPDAPACRRLDPWVQRRHVDADRTACCPGEGQILRRSRPPRCRCSLR